MKLPQGIIPVLQTPFDLNGNLDLPSLERLVEDAIDAGAAGFLVPAVASEVVFLTPDERRQILSHVLAVTNQRIPVIAGASSDDPLEARRLALEGQSLGAAALLIAVPASCYAASENILPFFQQATAGLSSPLLIQDLEFNGPGLTLDHCRSLADHLPTLAGWKVETAPSGPKYTLLREHFGPDCHISGGWAVPQFIEALDRGVDAMIPEASMVRLYEAIRQKYLAGDRPAALTLFRAMLPILAFTNQEIRTSIAFFKRLLTRRGIFTTETTRWPGFQWDPHNTRIADELIHLYFTLAA